MPVTTGTVMVRPFMRRSPSLPATYLSASLGAAAGAPGAPAAAAGGPVITAAAARVAAAAALLKVLLIKLQTC